MTAEDAMDTPLHSTMFLLIPTVTGFRTVNTPSFTFHYVSINTIPGRKSAGNLYHFTFHYVSINTLRGAYTNGITPNFTFHYVSINTCEILYRTWLCYLYIPLCFY